MDGLNFNQEWYGTQAKVLTQTSDSIVVDYGCKGRGIVKNYKAIPHRKVGAILPEVI